MQIPEVLKNKIADAFKKLGYEFDSPAEITKVFDIDIDTQIYQRFRARVISGSGIGEASVAVDVYNSDINPQWVIASAHYEKQLNIGSHARIIDTGQVNAVDFFAGYIVRDFRGSLDNGNFQRVEGTTTFLQSTLHYFTSLQDAQIGVLNATHKPLVHGFITPDQFSLDKHDGIRVAGANNIYLTRLAAYDPHICELFFEDSWINRFRYPTRKNCESPSLQDDLWSLGIITLSMISRDSDYFMKLHKKSSDVHILRMYLEKQIKDVTLSTRDRKHGMPDITDVLNALLLNKTSKLTLHKLISLCSPEFLTEVSESEKRKNKESQREHEQDKPKRISLSDPLHLLDDQDREELAVRIEYVREKGPKYPILITGPKGCGKSTLARAIHYKVYGNWNPHFYPVNCSMLNGDLMESHIFGHVKGAFTGAYRKRDGVLARCSDSSHGGTVFLDEIHHLTPQAQAKLLGIFDSPFEFSPVGALEEKSKTCTATIILATNRDISSLLANAILADDFLSRISKYFTIHINSLKSSKKAIDDALETEWHRACREFDADFAGELRKDHAQVFEVFRNAGFPGSYRDSAGYVVDAIFLLKTKKKKKQALVVSRQEAEKIIHKRDSRYTHPGQKSTSRINWKVEFPRYARALLKYAQNAAPGTSPERIADALGLTNENGLPSRQRFYTLKKLILNDIRRKPSDRTLQFDMSELRTLEDFCNEYTQNR